MHFLLFLLLLCKQRYAMWPNYEIVVKEIKISLIRHDGFILEVQPKNLNYCGLFVLDESNHAKHFCHSVSKSSLLEWSRRTRFICRPLLQLCVFFSFNFCVSFA